MPREDYDEIEKNKPFRTIEGAHPDVRMNVLNELTPSRRLLLLERLRKIVEEEDLDGYDDDMIGFKNNECTWGLCRQDKKLWPDPQDYKWPHDENRVAPIRRVVACPLDTGPNTANGNYGCFYRCMFFGRRTSSEELTREAVLARIDELMDELKKEL